MGSRLGGKVDSGSLLRALATLLYGTLTRRPAMRAWIESVPVPVRFSDGRIRVVQLRLARLAWLWHTHPVGHVESLDAYAAYAGGDVLDVGAYHGWYSVLLAPKARPGDRFVSFEPDPRAQPVLLATLAGLLGAFPKLEMWPVRTAVGDGAGAVVTFPLGDAGHPRVASGDGNGEATVSIDEFVRQWGLRPRYIKIDVEGAEWFVLRGMHETLIRHRPIVLLEIHPQWQPEGVRVKDVEGVLEEVGYTCRVLQADLVAVRQLWSPAATPAGT